MFGIGSSVIAAIYLSRNRIKDANLCFTHSLIVSILFVLLLSVIIILLRKDIIEILGGSTKILPLVCEYVQIFIPFIFLQIILIIGQLIIRLDGSPNFAMLCNAIPAIVNIILDFIFIYTFEWGLSGAAWASVIGMITGTILFLVYMLKFRQILRFQFGGFSPRNLRTISKNIVNTISIGFSALLSELAVSSMFLIGNNIFIRTLGEDGVAAFSVVCYLFPLVYMGTIVKWSNLSRQNNRLFKVELTLAVMERRA